MPLDLFLYFGLVFTYIVYFLVLKKRFTKEQDNAFNKYYTIIAFFIFAALFISSYDIFS